MNNEALLDKVEEKIAKGDFRTEALGHEQSRSGAQRLFITPKDEEQGWAGYGGEEILVGYVKPILAERVSAAEELGREEATYEFDRDFLQFEVVPATRIMTDHNGEKWTFTIAVPGIDTTGLAYPNLDPPHLALLNAVTQRESGFFVAILDFLMAIDPHDNKKRDSIILLDSRVAAIDNHQHRMQTVVEPHSMYYEYAKEHSIQAPPAVQTRVLELIARPTESWMPYVAKLFRPSNPPAVDGIYRTHLWETACFLMAKLKLLRDNEFRFPNSPNLTQMKASCTQEAGS